MGPAEASIVAAALFGLVIGSFLNVVVHRLPLMLEAQWKRDAAELSGQPAPDTPVLNLMVPRSRCPSCGHQITALENIPVISYVFLRGRCSQCHAGISMRYPAVELLAGAASAVAVWFYGANVAGVAAAGLSLVLLTLTFIDLDTQLLPDSMTLPLMWAGLLLNVAGTFTPLSSAVIGAAAGYLSLWTVYWAFKLVTGKEGMGYGDFKLLAALGAWFGWQALPSIILLSSVVGAVTGITMIMTKRLQSGNPIPFGPYLAGAGLLALYFRGPLAGLFGLPAP